IACQPKKAADVQEVASEGGPEDLPADFRTFFDRFHTDSAYQMSRIIFPLEGMPATLEADPESTGERFFWSRSEWRLHRPFTDPSREFDNWFELKDDRIIEHWIHLKGTHMHMFRRFA